MGTGYRECFWTSRVVWERAMREEYAYNMRLLWFGLTVVAVAALALGMCIAVGPASTHLLQSSPEYNLLSANERMEAQAKMRDSLFAAVSGALVVVGLVVAYAEYEATRAKTKLDTEAHMSKIMLDAVNQLNSNSPSARLAGVHALTSLASRNLSDQDAVRNILLSYLRNQTREKADLASTAALRTLAKLRSDPKEVMDLGSAYLVGLDLRGIDLSRFRLTSADLRDTRID